MKRKLSFAVAQWQPHTEQGASTPWSLKDRRLYLPLSQWSLGLRAMTTVVVSYVSDEVQLSDHDSTRHGSRTASTLRLGPSHIVGLST